VTIIGSLSLLLNPVFVGDAAAEDTLCSQGNDWMTCYRAAEDDYHGLLTRWRELLSRSQSGQASLMAARLDLQVQLDALSTRQGALRERQVELNRSIYAIQQGQAVRDTLLDDFDRRIQDSRVSVERAVNDLAAGLDATPKSGPARTALNGWWNAHRFLDWNALIDYGRDPREPFRRDLESAVPALGEGPTAAVTALMHLADEEGKVREASRDYLLRNTAPDDLGPIQEELAKLEQDIRRGDDDQRELQGKLDAIATGPQSKEDRDLLAAASALASRYGRLEDVFEEDPAKVREVVPRGVWCDLYVHGGVAGTLAGLPSGLDTLRNGVSTYGGSCLESVAHDLDLLPVQAAWSKALYLESQEPPAWLIIDEVQGVWTLDGQNIPGPGPTRLLVGAGTHLITYERGADDAEDLLVEDFKSDDHLGFRADRGKIVLEVLPGGVAEWVIPVRHEVFTVEAEPLVVYEPDWRVSVTGTALAFDGEALLGGTAEGLHSALRYGPLRLEAGAAFDWLGSEHAYAYGRSSTAAMIRLRGVILARYATGRLRPLATLSPGFVPPFQAITLDAAAGLDYRINNRLTATGRFGLTSSFWRRDATWLEPMAQVGLSAWY